MIPTCLARLAGAGVAILCVSQAGATGPSLTIYNEDFAVVRDTVALDLKAGANEVRCTDIAAHVEADSVILRDPAGRHPLRILEQNYRADPVSAELLLSMYEGQTIDFLVTREGKEEVVKGRIIRSAYVPHQTGLQRYGEAYYASQMAHAYPGGSAGQPIIEVDGKLRFSLPGVPLFPALSDEAVLKPTLHWKIETPQAGRLEAELSYVTGGMSWQADYNVVSPREGHELEVVGWVTMDNQSGRGFDGARIKLMAGDVSKLSVEEMRRLRMSTMDQWSRARTAAPAVVEQPFDEYHLYMLERPASLRDRETKQVEFVRAAGVRADRLYVYDGTKPEPGWLQRYGPDSIRHERTYGTQCNPKVWVMNEFSNSEANHLGIPLPKGRMRFYRRGDDGQLEFVGENTIDHTPRDQTLRVYVGNAFDVTGERVQTDFRLDERRQWVDESFEIKLASRKKEPVEVRVVEHLYRGLNWEITTHSHPFEKKDSRTAEFRIPVKPDQAETIRYTVHYTW